MPTYINKLEDEQTPGAKYGQSVNYLPEDVNKLYDEARDSFSKNAFTCTVMCCRKILMHVAVSKGAEKGKSFTYYVKYLSDKNIVTVDADEWIDSIREEGNIANHEIKINNRDEAKEIIDFVQMLLMLVYDFPNRKNNFNTESEE
jgi:hypothetical protein